MRTIKISEEVWQAIAAKGKFGETENDVLERIFKIQRDPYKFNFNQKMPPTRKKYADKRMSAVVQDKTLHISFQDGNPFKWTLPEPSDKPRIRVIRQEAINFARINGASFGQEQAVKKALTDAGYWLTK